MMGRGLDLLVGGISIYSYGCIELRSGQTKLTLLPPFLMSICQHLVVTDQLQRKQHS